jgi:hypothetical protein
MRIGRVGQADWARAGNTELARPTEPAWMTVRREINEGMKNSKG